MWSNLVQITGSKAPDWPTFTPTSQAALFAEVQIWIQALQDPTIWDHTSHLWLCHCLGFGMCVRKRGTDEWFLTLGHIEHLATLAWRVRLVKFAGHTFMVPLLPTSDFCDAYAWLVCADPDLWLAQPIRWVSPVGKFGLHRVVGQATSSSSSGASAPKRAKLASIAELPSECIGAAICVGDEVPVLTECANNAFAGFNEALLTRLLKFYGVDFAKGADLFDKIIAGAKQFGGMCGNDLVSALYRRVRPNPHTASHDDAFFESEILQGCFDASDVKQVQQYAESTKTAETKASSFEEKLRDYHRSCRPRSQAKAKASASVGRRLPKPAPGISQANAQAFLPPGGRLSKDAPNSRWLVVMRPHGTISRSWPCWGEVESLAKVCKWAWEHHTRLEGGACPHDWIQEARWQNS